MSDWQKVRITFTDAGGSEVSAAMWQHRSNDWLRSQPEFDLDGFVMQVSGAKVEKIRELPTGVGAVVRLKGGVVDTVLVRNRGGVWCAEESEDDLFPEALAGRQYDILSEGIQL